jgi:ribosomal protein S18 acetylase RimI-like enzyme
MTSATLQLRPAVPSDQAFFVELYRSTREDLLGLLADPRYIDGLIAMQQQMQVAGYRSSYPDAFYQVLELDGAPVGRLVTAAVAGALRVVDIAVMPRARGRGVAGEALRRLQVKAGLDGRDLTLAVRKDNAGARRLYAALGFAVEAEDGAVLQLRWRGALARPSTALQG